MHEAEDGDGREPQGGNGREKRGDLVGAAELESEQSGEYEKSGRHDVGLKAGIDDAEALDCGQHRNSRRDHRIAEKEGGSHHAEDEDEAALAPQCLLGEHHKGEDAAFTLVVGTHQDQHIFDRHDEDERPDQQRDDGDNVAMHIAAGARHMGKGFAHRIERASSDVAEDDTDAGEGELELAAELGTRFRIAAGGTHGAVTHAAAESGAHRLFTPPSRPNGIQQEEL